MAGIDWSSLHPDLLRLILRSLPIASILCSAFVCTAWFSAVRELRRQRRLLDDDRVPDPWLMVLEIDRHYHHLRFYSVSERRSYNSAIPFNYRFYYVLGSSHGWVILANEVYDIYFSNPITGARIHELRRLPEWKPRAGLPGDHDSTDDDDEMIDNYSYKLADDRLGKISLSCNPSDGNYVILFLKYGNSNLSFSRKNDLEWTTIETNYMYRDVTYCNEMFYLITDDCYLIVRDLDGKQRACLLLFSNLWDSPFFLDFGWMVPSSPLGDLCIVWHPNDRAKVYLAIWRVIELELDIIETLGNYSLFIGFGDTSCVYCTEHSQFRRNCVYINEGMKSKGIIIFSVEDRTVETIPLDLNTRSSWRNLIWVNPSLF